MKKVEIDQMEFVKGGCSSGTAFFGGLLCAGAIFSGLGAIMLGPSCLGMVYACLYK